MGIGLFRIASGLDNSAIQSTLTSVNPEHRHDRPRTDQARPRLHRQRGKARRCAAWRPGDLFPVGGHRLGRLRPARLRAGRGGTFLVRLRHRRRPAQLVPGCPPRARPRRHRQGAGPALRPALDHRRGRLRAVRAARSDRPARVRRCRRQLPAGGRTGLCAGRRAPGAAADVERPGDAGRLRGAECIHHVLRVDDHRLVDRTVADLVGHRQPQAGIGRVKALQGFDAALEHRVRLAISVLLARHGEISFSRFKEQLELTDGNLGAQLRRLEDEEYVALRRDFVERKPVTWYKLTAKGRKALDKHLQALQGMISAAGPGD
ncbi:hypothetical protein CSC74_09540 [Pseudoxanthomonas yeongjuensis]|nr:hypothetical protein CSC74_09540 [Pseudoxanthomonas yeongjuensis]